MSIGTSTNAQLHKQEHQKQPRQENPLHAPVCMPLKMKAPGNKICTKMRTCQHTWAFIMHQRRAARSSATTASIAIAKRCDNSACSCSSAAPAIVGVHVGGPWRPQFGEDLQRAKGCHYRRPWQRACNDKDAVVVAAAGHHVANSEEMRVFATE